MEKLPVMDSRQKIISTNNWAVEYDGQSVITVMCLRDKITFETLNRVVTNEGGYIDTDGIIHKGTAEDKLAVLD